MQKTIAEAIAVELNEHLNEDDDPTFMLADGSYFSVAGVSGLKRNYDGSYTFVLSAGGKDVLVSVSEVRTAREIPKRPKDKFARKVEARHDFPGWDAL